MAQHVRYADGGRNDRAVIKFVREDLLWRGRVGNASVPFDDGPRLVGPTILDLLLRDPGGDDDPPCWTLRDSHAFEERDKARRTENGHPFKACLLSGGRHVDSDAQFVRVAKWSSVSIGAYAYRLAVGALGSVRDAHAAIASKAVAAWSADLARSRTLFDAINAAPDGRLEETPAIAALRPAGSISDQIETDILREACLLLGVDPDLPIKRPPGRPRKDGAGQTEAGDWIAVTLVDGLVSARTVATVHGIAGGTDLSSLNVIKLVALLDALKAGGAELDAELLEAYLDAAAPDWRDVAPADDDGAAGDDPYTVLGVSRSMSFEDITAAYRRAMQAIHPDKGACPPWFAQAAAAAFRRIKEERNDRSHT
jgi:DnaJ-domain-containing protein 1